MLPPDASVWASLRSTRTIYLQPTPSLLCCACLEPPKLSRHYARPQESLPWLEIFVVQLHLVFQVKRARAYSTYGTSHVAKGKCARPYVSVGLVYLPVAHSRDVLEQSAYEARSLAWTDAGAHGSASRLWLN